MKVQELIDLLKELDGELEVQLATQPNYPIAMQVFGVAAPQGELEIDPCTKCGHSLELVGNEVHHVDEVLDEQHQPVFDLDSDDGESLPPGIAWIVAGDQPNQPCAPRSAWDVARGW